MIPYERIVQWTAGPISILAGWLATQLVAHVSAFGAIGLGKSQVAHALVTVGTFAVAAAVTYAAHHKWLTNLALFWEHNSATPLDLEEATTVLPDRPESAVQPDGPPQPPIPVPPGTPPVPQAS